MVGVLGARVGPENVFLVIAQIVAVGVGLIGVAEDLEVEEGEGVTGAEAVQVHGDGPPGGFLGVTHAVAVGVLGRAHVGEAFAFFGRIFVAEEVAQHDRHVPRSAGGRLGRDDRAVDDHDVVGGGGAEEDGRAVGEPGALNGDPRSAGDRAAGRVDGIDGQQPGGAGAVLVVDAGFLHVGERYGGGRLGAVGPAQNDRHRARATGRRRSRDDHVVDHRDVGGGDVSEEDGRALSELEPLDGQLGAADDRAAGGGDGVDDQHLVGGCGVPDAGHLVTSQTEATAAGCDHDGESRNGSFSRWG